MDQRQVELERDLYRLLLDTNFHSRDAIEGVLTKALDLIVQMTRARIGYIELRTREGETWWSTHRCDRNISLIRGRISSGIIAEALSCDETIVTPSAFLDPRFSEQDSVKNERIEAVLCSPFGDGNIRGVIYLQGSSEIGLNQPHCMMDTVLFTRHISPLLRRFKHQLEGKKHLEQLREKADFDTIVGRSVALQTVIGEAIAISELDVTVLLMGESGCGKSIFAERIHKNSQRKDRPFVHLNCANLPEQLVESELFGAAKGAHSSAHTSRKGKIAAAQGGTLFLDEIGELPIGVQAKLLQFLEEGTYYPLGSSVLVNADVRVVTASNVDFKEQMKRGFFREDLFYRISVFPLEIPPLRARIDDIPDLVNHFCIIHCKRFGIPLIEVSQEAALLLQESEWPGNIRQLENKVQQGILRAKTDGAALIEPRHFFRNDDPKAEAIRTTTYREGKDFWERRFISARLEQHGWNVAETARSLGLSRSHMNNLMNLHGLQRIKSRQAQNASPASFPE